MTAKKNTKKTTTPPPPPAPGAEQGPSEDEQKLALETEGRELGIELDRRLSVGDLQSQIDAKKAEIADAAAEAEAGQKEADKKPKAKKVKKPPFTVAAGKSISCRKGNIGPGEGIEVRDMPEGKKVDAIGKPTDEKTRKASQKATFDRLIDSGHIIEN